MIGAMILILLLVFSQVALHSTISALVECGLSFGLNVWATMTYRAPTVKRAIGKAVLIGAPQAQMRSHGLVEGLTPDGRKVQNTPSSQKDGAP